MASLWYYTSDGKQMEPVSLSALRKLAESGSLKPTDLVWTEGMAKWSKAGGVQEIFAEVPAPPPPPASIAKPTRSATEEVSSSRDAEFDDVPKPRKSRLLDDEDDDRPRRRRRFEDDDEDDRPRRRRPQSSGLNPWLVVGGVLVTVFLVCGGVAFVTFTAIREAAINFDPDNLHFIGHLRQNAEVVNFPANGQSTYTLDLADDEGEIRSLACKQGHRYDVAVKTIQGNVDVDVFIKDPRGAHVASDVLPDKDAFVNFTANETGTYKIQVNNLGPGPAKSTITVKEIAPVANEKGGAANPGPVGPDVKVGAGSFQHQQPLPVGEEMMFKVQVRPNLHVIMVKQTQPPLGGMVAVQVTATKDGDPANEQVGRRIGGANNPNNSTLMLSNLPPNQVVIVRVKNVGQVPITSFTVTH